LAQTLNRQFEDAFANFDKALELNPTATQTAMFW